MCIIHLRLITVYSHLCSHIYTFTVPTRKVEKYLKSKGCVVQDASEADRSHFSSPVNVSVFRGQGHGDWPLDLSSNQLVARAAGYLVEQIK